MDGKANIYDIARLTGTTIAAVSRAFDPKGKIEQSKREAILKTAESTATARTAPPAGCPEKP